MATKAQNVKGAPVKMVEEEEKQKALKTAVFNSFLVLRIYIFERLPNVNRIIIKVLIFKSITTCCCFRVTVHNTNFLS